LHSVYGICNPLMDMVVYGGFDVLAAQGATAGTMNLIEEPARRRLLEQVRVARMVPGGSAANTLRGLAWLGAGAIEPPVYSGAIGHDEIGDLYERQLKVLGVEPRLVRKQGTTGTSTIIVTPDHERTMFTCLAASREFGPGDCTGALPDCRWLYFTGYMWDTDNQRSAVTAVAEQARRAGVRVAFDLADPFAVRRYRDAFLGWIPGRVDLLFGNRQEMALLAGGGDAADEDLVRRTAALAPMVVMKVGARGCVVNERGVMTTAPARPVKVVDTIGAGDFFAAGFLYGLLLGRPTADCSRIANSLAAAVVGVEGCSLEQMDRGRVLEDC
jgi:sugar/nucleoside kinase (ribokinase family)